MLSNKENTEPAATTPLMKLGLRVEISERPRNVSRKLSNKSLLLKLAEENSSISLGSLRDSCRLPFLEQDGSKNASYKRDEETVRTSNVPVFIHDIGAPPLYQGTVGNVPRAA